MAVLPHHSVFMAILPLRPVVVIRVRADDVRVVGDIPLGDRGERSGFGPHRVAHFQGNQGRGQFGAIGLESAGDREQGENIDGHTVLLDCLLRLSDLWQTIALSNGQIYLSKPRSALSCIRGAVSCAVPAQNGYTSYAKLLAG